MEADNFEIRYTCPPPRIRLWILDKTEGYLTTSTAANLADLTESPVLWTNNPNLVRILQEYFEILWLTSTQQDDPALANTTA